MTTPIVMPQMGESIAEGTIVRWIKKVGEAVDRDEPLFEISTDKVDAEIPSPAAGVLAEIKVQEGETVPVNSVVAMIGDAGRQSSSAGAAAVTSRRRAGAARPKPPAAAVVAGETTAHAPGPVSRRSTPRREVVAARAAASRRNTTSTSRRLHGTGIAGRVTKHDILELPRSTRPGIAGRHAPAPDRRTCRDRSIPASASRSCRCRVMRKKIAEHMVLSRRTSAHVHSVFEVNFSRVAQIRDAKKAEYERAGAKLTYLSFIVKAVVDALRRFPCVNASIDGDNIVYKKDINLGIAVALDWGLIVPVIKNADEKNLLGLSRAIADLADRARAKQLKPDEVQGGTFTITNPGMFGAQFGMPIINQPQVAILGVGAIEKRAGRDRRCDRDPADGVSHARLRPPADRRRRSPTSSCRSVKETARATSTRVVSVDGRIGASWRSGGSAPCPTPRRSTLQRRLVEERAPARFPTPAAPAPASRTSSRSA